MKYVNVVINNNNDSTDTFYTYGCEEDAVQVGQKVTVPFNRGNKLTDGYVFQVLDGTPEEIKNLKYITSVDREICLTEEIIETCIWMRKRYVCRYIDAVNCFTPVGSISKRGKKRNPFKDTLGEAQDHRKLTEEQSEALKSLSRAIDQGMHKLFLINGVTSSGKTEIYMRAIAKCVMIGKTAIMMVPEISLTKQIIERFIGRFGADCIAVLHSKLSMGERYDEWVRIRNGQVKIVIGARSAVFAPLENIGAIILDEEHEATYKSDMTPKYETVEVAVKRAKAHGGILIMGSATPSVVSYCRAQTGIYEEITLKQRYNKVPMPEVDIVDMREELKNGNLSIFSNNLHQKMEQCLKDQQQIILFLNRRGYSTFVSCRECGYVMKCPECGISLTYHKKENVAICHYCGYRQALPKICPECNSKYIKHFGTGTEKVEEAAAELFEGARIARLDLDTIKRKGSIDKILDDFQKGKTDILVGTQLVAKGLDFANIGLVGIVSADVTLNIPDFRSSERTFQLITQAAGRAGRGNIPGKVVIQTYSPENYAIIAASEQNYTQFYDAEIKLRAYMHYPPYSDLIQILFTAQTMEDALAAAEVVDQKLRKQMGVGAESDIFKPQPAPMSKTGDIYRCHILIKAPLGKRREYTQMLMDIKREINMRKKKNFTISIDFNPYSFI